MPAIDQCEPAVINALQKAGWAIVDRPFSIQVDKPKRAYVYADLKLHHNSNNQTVIIIEVKCFAIHDRLFRLFQRNN
jgi:flagellar basal body-associated protein FliL